MKNTALNGFDPMIGDWDVAGSHPYVPDIILRGRASFHWHEGGAFVIMRSAVDHPKFPKGGVAIFGSDDGSKEIFMLYFDDRGVSRKYDVTVSKKQTVWRRDDPAFSQKNVITLINKNKMISKGTMSQKGGPWEDDLSLSYTRIQ
jgi:hypothetical protein